MNTITTRLFCIMTLALAGSGLRAQPPSAGQQTLAAYLEANLARYADPDPGLLAADAIDRFVVDATRAGLIRSAGDLAHAKALYRESVDRLDAAQGSGNGRAGGGGGGVPAAITERENNDTLGLADTLINSDSATGVVGPAATDPRDVYRWLVAPECWATISVKVLAGAVPGLSLADADGRFIVPSVLINPTTRSLTIQVPAGAYTLTVTGSNTYTLSTVCTPTTIPMLTGAPLTTLRPPLRRDLYHCYRVVCGPTSNLTVACVGGVGMNMVFTFARAKGGRIFLVDNVGTSLDPSLVTQPPAGVYYLFVYETGALTGGTYTIDADCVCPGGPPALTCGAPLVGNLATLDQKDIYSVTVGSLTSHTFTTTLGTLLDSIIEVYDADMGSLAENDDDFNPFVGNNSSLIHLPLPAGQYYVSVRPFLSAGQIGTYTVNSACAPAVITPLPAERFQVAGIPAGGSAAFSYMTCTPTHLEISASVATSRLSSYGADGKLRAWYGIGGAPGSVSLVGHSIQKDETVYIVARTITALAAPAFSMMLQGGLGIDAAAPGGTLRHLDKVGRIHAVFASPFTFGPWAVPTPFTGWLCVQPDMAFMTPIAGNGRVQSFTASVPLGILFQALSVESTFASGAMTNHAR